MNKRLLTFMLIISLVFNISFLSIFIYRKWIDKPQPPYHERKSQSLQYKYKKPQFSRNDWQKLHNMKEEIRPELEELMKTIRQERRELGQLLLEEKPDSLQVESRLNRINALQSKIEHTITFHLIKQKEMWPDSLRNALVHTIISRYKNMNPKHHGPGADRRHP